MITNKMAALCKETGAATKEKTTPHFIPRINHKQLKGIDGFEKLRTEWIAANPEHSELELLTACIGFAKLCGLALREELLKGYIRELGGHHG